MKEKYAIPVVKQGRKATDLIKTAGLRTYIMQPGFFYALNTIDRNRQKACKHNQDKGNSKKEEEYVSRKTEFHLF